MLFLLCCCGTAFSADLYGVVRSPAPVLNIPAAGLPHPDSCGQVRELEFIALPGTALAIRETVTRGGVTLFRFETAEYPSSAPLYIDSRHVTLRPTTPPARTPVLPVRSRVTELLEKAIGVPYVWGGNVQAGIRAPGGDGAPLFAGLDCSGLLYQATGGWTPRNTSSLVGFGTPVGITGKSALEIVAALRPLDLIVWYGHVVIVLDRERAIESRLECGRPGSGGVTVTPLLQRLREVMRTRHPADAWGSRPRGQKLFVVRRWIPE